MEQVEKELVGRTQPFSKELNTYSKKYEGKSYTFLGSGIETANLYTQSKAKEFV